MASDLKRAMEPYYRRLENEILATMREQREEFALTDATHSRSTARRKTKVERAVESARIDALCEALHHTGGVATPARARIELRERMLAEEREAAA